VLAARASTFELVVAEDKTFGSTAAVRMADATPIRRCDQLATLSVSADT
jgi:hypothetical protein